LVCGALAGHRDERTISLLAISVSQLDAHTTVQLELTLALAGAGHVLARRTVRRDRAQTGPLMRRRRFGGHAVDYGSASRVGRPSLTPSAAWLKESCDSANGDVCGL
jgi:DNA polymerase-4